MGSRLSEVATAEPLKHFKVNSLYPNPVFDGVVKLDVESSEIGTMKVQVIDLAGRTHLTNELQIGGQKDLSVNVSALPTGYYIFKLYFKRRRGNVPGHYQQIMHPIV